MTHRGTAEKRLVRAVGCALVAAILAGCGVSSATTRESASPAATGSPNSATASPTSQPSTTSPSESPSSPEDEAVAQAESAVREYYRVMDSLVIDPKADTSILEDVAISTGLGDAQNQINYSRSRDRRQIGATGIATLSATEISLQFSPDTQPPAIPTVKFEVCYDVSNVDVVDPQGNSVVSPDRPDQALTRLGVSNYDWPSASGWKVSWAEAKGEPCSSSVG